jgi:hypothetical protein
VRIACVAVGLVLVTALATQSPAGEPRFEETRIPHRDGSGRATVVEIDPKVPGARELVRGEERPAPARGEVSLPSPTPAPAATVQGRPERWP